MLIGVGDLHVDKLEAKIPGTADRIIETLDTVYARGKERGFSTFVLFGDVFDVPAPDDIFKIKILAFLLRHTDVCTYILMGNHDYASANHHALRIISSFFRLKVFNGHVFTQPKLVTVEGDRYWFCPHPYAVPSPRPVRYSFGHFAYDGARADNNYTVRSKKSPDGRWVLGDFHGAQRGRNYMYIGSLTQLGWSESSTKYYMELDDKPRLVRAPVPYELKKLTVEHADDLQRIDTTAWWQVILSKGVKLPDNWQAAYPNVVDVPYRSSAATSKVARALIAQQTNDDPLVGLVPMLLQRGRLNDNEIALAQEWISNAGIANA